MVSLYNVHDPSSVLLCAFPKGKGHHEVSSRTAVIGSCCLVLQGVLQHKVFLLSVSSRQTNGKQLCAMVVQGMLYLGSKFGGDSLNSTDLFVCSKKCDKHLRWLALGGQL